MIPEWVSQAVSTVINIALTNFPEHRRVSIDDHARLTFLLQRSVQFAEKFENTTPSQVIEPGRPLR